ncbi:MAG: nicotinate phosphoribosyltransferase, partial [Actinobacteria bacterium]|nr:nicotinate phosphoribosyltransferase [Actinomycetota bacterium]
MDQSYTTSLLTDRYELTMLDAAIRAGIVGRQAIFDVYARSLPDGRRFGILCGTGRLLELLDRFYFSEEDL